VFNRFAPLSAALRAFRKYFPHRLPANHNTKTELRGPKVRTIFPLMTGGKSFRLNLIFPFYLLLLKQITMRRIYLLSAALMLFSPLALCANMPGASERAAGRLQGGCKKGLAHGQGKLPALTPMKATSKTAIPTEKEPTAGPTAPVYTGTLEHGKKGRHGTYKYIKMEKKCC
jgi:hypothetical protein